MNTMVIENNQAQLQGEAVPKFLSWFHNNMAIILMMMQLVGPRSRRSLLRAEFFLNDLEHHYIDSCSGKIVWDAFRYLRAYLRVYPRVRSSHSLKAFSMVELIYASLGLTLNLRYKKLVNHEK